MELQGEECREPLADALHRVRAMVLLVGGNRVHYDLFVTEKRIPQFFVEVSIGDEVFRAALGKDFVYAARVYDCLLRGEVTPCTAGDIIEDMRGVASELE